MPAVTRPLPARVLGPILLLLMAGLVAIAPPASAAAAGDITLRAECPYLGQYSSGVYVTESFSGLDPSPSNYSVVATRAATVGTDTIAPDPSGWYPDGSNAHVTAPTYDFAYNGVGSPPVVAPGYSYHWALYKTGVATPVLEADATVQSPTGCTTPPPPTTGIPPTAASFGSSPHKVKVNHHGRFHYSFGAKAGVHGTIVIAHGGKVWAQGSFVVPSTGTETIGLKVTTKARHYLAAHHKATTAVTVVLSNSYGSRSAGTTLVLRWA